MEHFEDNQLHLKLYMHTRANVAYFLYNHHALLSTIFVYLHEQISWVTLLRCHSW